MTIEAKTARLENSSSGLKPEQYHAGFQEFLERTDQKAISLEWFRKHFKDRSDIKRVLSIGCGEGIFDLALLEALPNVQSYVGVEPNNSHLTTYQKRIESAAPSTLPTMRLIQACFEDVGLRSEFDLVIFSQSLYYPKDKQATLEKAFELLDVNGEMIIFHTIGNRGIDQLKRVFSSLKYSYTGEALQQDLEATGLPFQVEVLPSAVQITGFPATLIEFMLERTVSTEEYQQAQIYLQQQCPDGNLDHPLLAVRAQANLTAAEYRDDYRVFRNLTDTIPAIHQWTSKLLGKLDTPIENMLSIGCGNGYLDATCFLDELPTVQSYTGVDTNQAHLEECRNQLASYHQVAVELLPQAFEDFHTDQRYDLIVLSHMLYYTPRRKFILTKACTLLKEKGTLIVLHQTERGINALQKRYGRVRHAYNSAELAQELDTLAVPYSYEELDSYVNLEQISDSLVRFFLEGAITRWQADDVRQFLLRQYPEKRMHHPIGAFVITEQDVREHVHPRLLSDEEYALSFGEFLDRSNQHTQIISWAAEQTLIDNSSVKSMLSVGCGTALFDLEFAQALPNLDELVLVEPNRKHLAAIEKNAAESTGSFKTRIVAGTLEDLAKEEQNSRQYDLIVFAHSLYYVADLTVILKQAAGMLSPNGQLLLLHEPEYGGMHQLNKRLGIFGRVSLTAQHLKDSLIKLGADIQFDTIPVAVDIRNTSDLLIDFLLEREPTKAEISEARDQLLEIAPDEVLIQDTLVIVVDGFTD